MAGFVGVHYNFVFRESRVRNLGVKIEIMGRENEQRGCVTNGIRRKCLSGDF